MSTGDPVAAEAPAAGRALHLIGADAFERGAVDDLLDAVDRGAFAAAAVTAVASAGSRAEALADTLCRIGLLLLQHGRGEAAVGAYRMALAYWPPHAGALLLLGRVHRAAGDFAAAEECARRLAALEPRDSDVHRELALALLGGGKLVDADRAAQAAVQLAPFAAAAWHLLGVVRARRERPAQAAALIGEAVRLDPAMAPAWRDLAGALQRLDRPADAEAAAGRFAALVPEDAAASRLHALTLLAVDRPADAETALRKAVALAPDFADAWSDLAGVLLRLGRLAEAEAGAQRFVALRPGDPDAHNQLGLLLLELHQFAAAERQFQAAIACRPDYADSHVFLGEVRARRRKLDLAERDFRRALELDPDNIPAHGRLALLLSLRGQPMAAAARFEALLARYPEATPIALRLGRLWCEMGRLADAERLARSVLDRTPRSAPAHALLGRVRECAGEYAAAANAYLAAVDGDKLWHAAWLGLLRAHRHGAAAASAFLARCDPALLERYYDMLLNDIQSGNDSEDYGAVARDGAALLPGNKLMRTACAYSRAYDSEAGGADICGEYCAIWGPLADRSVATRPARSAASPLRIGYIGQYLHPTLMNDYFSHHDFDAFEIFLYSDDDRGRIDPLPPQVRWYPVKGIDVAESFRRNNIDLCVDVFGPFPFGPFMELADVINRRIAPVQCSFINTFASFGGSAHDFIIADPEAIPPEYESDFAERVIRLPATQWSYAPPKIDVEPGELPAMRNGHITFGVANRAIKFTNETLAMWAAAMHAVPGSRLSLFGSLSLNFMLRQHVRARFASHGVDPDRIDFAGPGSQRQTLEFYRTVDIGLDSFPYTGGITGFETLWMGVPLVTRTGRLLVSRQGRSMLACIDRRHWIADSADGFVDIVARLAGDIPALAHERAALRQAVVNSPLCDGRRFARDLETAFRTMTRPSA